MLVKKFDYSKSEEDIFYKIIYPIYSKEFLFGNDYNSFAIMLSGNFILNESQWACILEHWETKENILNCEHI